MEKTNIIPIISLTISIIAVFMGVLTYYNNYIVKKNILIYNHLKPSERGKSILQFSFVLSNNGNTDILIEQIEYVFYSGKLAKYQYRSAEIIQQPYPVIIKPNEIKVININSKHDLYANKYLAIVHQEDLKSYDIGLSINFTSSNGKKLLSEFLIQKVTHGETFYE